MPELPEVETVRLGLMPAMQGRCLEGVDVRRENLRYPIPQDMQDVLGGKSVQALRRRGKYLVVDFDGGHSLIIHLGMSGAFRVGECDDNPADQKHDHIVMNFSGGMRAIYNDPRRFGFFLMMKHAEVDAYAPFAVMGPEPLGNGFNGAYLVEALSKKASPIKTALLDQSVVAGLGNIYVCEALYRARIHPETPAKNVKEEALEALTSHVRDVLNEALASGGSSLKDHKQVDGTLGYFQHRFAVYDREGHSCPHAGCQESEAPCVRRIKQAGRSTFFCENLQRLA